MLFQNSISSYAHYKQHEGGYPNTAENARCLVLDNLSSGLDPDFANILSPISNTRNLRNKYFVSKLSYSSKIHSSMLMSESAILFENPCRSSFRRKSSIMSNCLNSILIYRFYLVSFGF